MTLKENLLREMKNLENAVDLAAGYTIGGAYGDDIEQVRLWEQKARELVVEYKSIAQKLIEKEEQKISSP